MATHSSILAQKIPMEEPGGLQFMGSQRVGHSWVTKHAHKCLQVLTTQSCHTFYPLTTCSFPFCLLIQFNKYNSA